MEEKTPQVIDAEDQAWNDQILPVAKKIFRAIADKLDDAPMSIVKSVDVEAAEWSKTIVQLALEEMLKANMRKDDAKMILQMLVQPASQVMDRVNSSIAMNYERALTRVFGAENERSITMGQLHSVLMGETKPE